MTGFILEQKFQSKFNETWSLICLLLSVLKIMFYVDTYNDTDWSQDAWDQSSKSIRQMMYKYL